MNESDLPPKATQEPPANGPHEPPKPPEPPLPVEVPPPAPPAPVVEAPPLPEPPAPVEPQKPFDYRCPVCGANKGVDSGTKFDKRKLLLHVRIKHPEYDFKAYQKLLYEAEGKNAPVEKPEPPAPDFSDVTGIPQPTVTATPIPLPSPLAVNYEASAKLCFDMSTGLLAQIFGPEWKPNSEEERVMVVEALKRYFESIQMPDIPPGYMLCIVALAYSAPRFTAPTTRSKLVNAWLWFKGKFTRKKPAPLLAILAAQEKKAG